MKKVLLTIIYPFWYFFSNTYIGNVSLLVIIVTLPFFSIFFLFKDHVSDKDLDGSGIGIFSILISSFLIRPLFWLNDNLSKNYKKYGYKTEVSF